MKQTNAAQNMPTALSPEFTTWLETEKKEAKLHQRRLLKFTLLFLMFASFILLAEEVSVVEIILSVPGIAAP
jgi:hypothetical protein